MSSTLTSNTDSNNDAWSLTTSTTTTTENVNMSQEFDFSNFNHYLPYSCFEPDGMDESIIDLPFEDEQNGEFGGGEKGRFFPIRRQQRPTPNRSDTKSSLSLDDELRRSLHPRW